MKLKVAILITAFCVIAGFSGAQSPSPSAPSATAATGVPYTEHSVWNISLLKTKPGLDDDYLRSIAQSFKGTMEEEKKQGLIMDYKVLIGDASIFCSWSNTKTWRRLTVCAKRPSRSWPRS